MKPRELELEVKAYKLGLTDKESNLYRTKWFDYRKLHPIECNELFLSDYENVSTNFVNESGTGKKEFDKWFGKPLEDFYDYKNLNLARAKFDAIGCRYFFGITKAFRRAHDRHWADLLPVSQIADDIAILDIRDAWEEECRNTIQIPTSARYQSENYANQLDQTEWLNWFFNDVSKRQAPERAICTAMSSGVISHDQAEEMFGTETYTKAMWWAGMMNS